MPMPMSAQASSETAETCRKREAHKAGGEDEIGRGQHIAPPVFIDHAAGERAEQAREQQGRRENAEEPRAEMQRAEIGSAKTAGR